MRRVKQGRMSQVHLGSSCLPSCGQAMCGTLHDNSQWQWIIWMKQTPSSLLHLGEARKHIPRTSPWFGATEATRLLSYFLRVFSPERRILLTRLHSQTVFRHGGLCILTTAVESAELPGVHRPASQALDPGGTSVWRKKTRWKMTEKDTSCWLLVSVYTFAQGRVHLRHVCTYPHVHPWHTHKINMDIWTQDHPVATLS